MKLYNHQKEILKKNPKKYLVAWKTGVAKTLPAILWANQFSSALVIVPKHLKEQWKERLLNSPVKTLRFKIVTKEEFRRDFDKLAGYESIIVDEAHYFSGMKSTMSKNLIKYIKKHNVENIWLLTATPYLSTPWNIYRLAQILGHDWSYWSFKSKFFYDIKMGTRMIPKVKNNIEEDLAELVNKIGETKTLEECFDVPEQTDVVEFFERNKKQDKAIKEMTENETNPAVRYNYIHQIENGTLKGDEFNENQIFNCDKHDRIMELITEDDKVAIFCRYNLEIEQLKEKLSKDGRNIYIVNGSVKEKSDVFKAIEADDKCIAIINSACSEGYELPSIGTIIYTSLSWSYKDYAQSRGRFLRSNALKKNTYIHLVNKGGVDESVYDSMMRKEDFDATIFDRK